jgi:chromosomal replication initiation ATPase DnaA
LTAEIGRHLGGRAHTTIIYECWQIAKAKEGDTTLHTTLEGLKEQILRA